MSYAYLAGRFRHRYLLQGHRAELARIGIQTTSRWLDLKEEIEADATICAKIDAEDIRLASVLISFPEPSRSLPPTRGGHFWEEGYAYALGKRVIIVANRVHIFHHLPDVEFYQSWHECLIVLRQGQRPALKLVA
jgi:hypothetical protein